MKTDATYFGINGKRRSVMISYALAANIRVLVVLHLKSREGVAINTPSEDGGCVTKNASGGRC